MGLTADDRRMGSVLAVSGSVGSYMPAVVKEKYSESGRDDCIRSAGGM